MAPPSHLFQGYRWCCAIMVYICVLPLSSNASKQMIITIGNPGEEETKTPLELKGVERFESLTQKDYPKYETNFTTNLWKGVYHDLSISKASRFGGAGGQGYYVLTQSGDRPYQLEITPITQGRGPTYFGLWVTNLQPKYHLDFFYKKQPLFKITLQSIYDRIPRGGGYDGYWKNPYIFGEITPQAFVFMSFYFQAPFDEVHFFNPIHRFSSDNHFIGHWKDIWGTRVYVGTHLIIEPSTPETQPPSTPETQPPSTPGTQPPSTPETQPPSTPETQPRSTPETQPSRPEPAPRKAEPSRPKVAPRTPAKADLFPTISTVWITIGVILGRVALV